MAKLNQQHHKDGQFKWKDSEEIADCVQKSDKSSAPYAHFLDQENKVACHSCIGEFKKYRLINSFAQKMLTLLHQAHCLQIYFPGTDIPPNANRAIFDILMQFYV